MMSMLAHPNFRVDLLVLIFTVNAWTMLDSVYLKVWAM